MGVRRVAGGLDPDGPLVSRLASDPVSDGGTRQPERLRHRRLRVARRTGTPQGELPPIDNRHFCSVAKPTLLAGELRVLLGGMAFELSLADPFERPSALLLGILRARERRGPLCLRLLGPVKRILHLLAESGRVRWHMIWDGERGYRVAHPEDVVA